MFSVHTFKANNIKLILFMLFSDIFHIKFEKHGHWNPW